MREAQLFGVVMSLHRAQTMANVTAIFFGLAMLAAGSWFFT
jgi:hypothetical protein